MRDWRAKLARRAKEGDDNLVTLFLVTAVISVAIGVAIAVTHHGDSFLRRVPRSAVIYVHAEGSGLERLGSFLPPSIAVTKPSEVGVFAMPDADGELSWAWLLRWPKGRIADGMNCEARLDDGICLIISRQAMRDKQTAALRNDTASLYMDQRIVKSLASVRRFSLIQAYIQSEGFRNLVSDGVSLPVQTVMTWNNDGITSVWPVGSQVASLLDRRTRPNLADGDIIAIQGINEGDFQAPMQVVLGDRLKSTSRPMLAQLESIFARTSYFSVGATTSDYLIHLQGVSQVRLSDNLAAYFSSLQPIERPLTMPDGQTATEMAIDVSNLDFIDFGQGKLKLSSKTQAITVPDLAVKDDGKGGAWLMGGTYLNKPLTEPVEVNSRQVCFRSNASADFNPLDEVLIGYPHTCVIEGVDKSVVIYRGSPQ